MTSLRVASHFAGRRGNLATTITVLRNPGRLCERSEAISPQQSRVRIYVPFRLSTQKSLDTQLFTDDSDMMSKFCTTVESE